MKKTKLNPTLALDVATTSGWALLNSDGSIASGTWKNPGDDQVGKFACFGNWMKKWVDPRDDSITPAGANRQSRILQVIYEEPAIVRGHAVPLLFGFRAILLMNCRHYNVQVTPYSPSEIKRHATGKGNATKDDLKEAFHVGHNPLWTRLKRPWQDIEDDNEIDALYMLDLFLKDVGYSTTVGVNS
jgi:hypothetical protein